MKYFVMINYPGGNIPVPLVEDTEENRSYFPTVYQSYNEAETAAENNSTAVSYGYEIFEWDY